MAPAPAASALIPRQEGSQATRGDPEEPAGHCHEDPGAQRGCVSCPTSHSKQVAELGLGARTLSPTQEAMLPGRLGLD